MTQSVWRSTQIIKKGAAGLVTIGCVVLAHDERHLRRRLLHLSNGNMVMLDLKTPTHLEQGDQLLLDDGQMVGVMAAIEPLYEINAQGPLHLGELAWHLGNRHLPTQIEPHRLLIRRDPVIRQMLEGLGASVLEINEPFFPLKGAYHRHE